MADMSSKPTKKNATRALSIFTVLISIPIIASMIWLLYMREYDCENLLRLPKLQKWISVGLLFVFLVSNGVVFFKHRCPVVGLMVVMVSLLVMLIIGLGLVGAYKMESQAIPASPMWLKRKIHSDSKWNNIKPCIYDTRVCDELVMRSFTLKSYDFSMTKLSPIEVQFSF